LRPKADLVVSNRHGRETAARPLMHNFLDPELSQLPKRHWKFRANRSMRDVEPEVNLWVKALDNTELDEDDEP
jgi:hypothetical protein